MPLSAKQLAKAMSSTSNIIWVLTKEEWLKTIADLDSRLGSAQWERLYLEEGIVIDSRTIPPDAITEIKVEPIESTKEVPHVESIKEVPRLGNQWLENQVNEICNLARL